MKIHVPSFFSSHTRVRLAHSLRQRSALAPAGYRAGVVAMVLFAIVSASGAKVVLHSMVALPEDAAFRAAGVVMTKQQLQQRTQLMELVYGLQQPKDPAQLDKFHRSLSKAMAVSTIVDSAASEHNIVVADKAASDQLDKMIQDDGTKDRRTFIQELGSRGVSEQNVVDEIKRQQANTRLFAKLTESVKATTDADAQRYYDQHRPQMVSGEQRNLANIVVAAPDEAQQVADLAKFGADFGALAQQHSIDASTKDKGGELGMVQADQLDPGYAKAAFDVPAGGVFGPVQTPQGWNVGKANEVHPATPLSFDQVRDAIKTKLDNEAKLKVWDEFLTERIKEADVVYAPEYQPADPDAAPSRAGSDG